MLARAKVAPPAALAHRVLVKVGAVAAVPAAANAVANLEAGLAVRDGDDVSDDLVARDTAA